MRGEEGTRENGEGEERERLLLFVGRLELPKALVGSQLP